MIIWTIKFKQTKPEVGTKVICFDKSTAEIIITRTKHEIKYIYVHVGINA